MIYNRPVPARFEEKYIPEPMSGCWLWLDALSADGYGRFKVDNKNVPAHRMSYGLHVGKVPEDMVVRHRCDTPWCVNPDHLVVGTRADNNQDRKRRGRNGDRWHGICKRGHDLDIHGYHRSNGTRYCATCQGVSPRPKNGAWL